MNVLIISPIMYPCSTGGVQIFNYNFSRGLAKKGVKVHILTPCKYDFRTRNISTMKLSKTIFLHPTLSICFHVLLTVIKLRKTMDIIHIPYTSNSFLAYPILIARKLFKIPPYVIVIHGGGMHPWKPKIIHKRFFQHADEIIAVSKIIKIEYEKRCGRKILVIPPLIPFRESKNLQEKLRTKYGFDGYDLIVIFVGAVKKIKGCDILLDAFLDLGTEYLEKYHLKLLYVGDGPMKAPLMKRVYEKGLNKYVRFLGNIRYEKISDLYRMSDIYVIPSLFEGTPIALLEAMFNGLSIIGTDTAGISNIISSDRNGLLFQKEDIVDLKEKMKKLVEDKELRMRLGRNAKEDYVKTHNFDNMICDHIKLYKTIIQERERSG